MDSQPHRSHDDASATQQLARLSLSLGGLFGPGSACNTLHARAVFPFQPGFQLVVLRQSRSRLYFSN
eukprot:scaffold108155_cov31-Prasinocladus_malaysianus.AAC.1